jgi:ribonuclease J
MDPRRIVISDVGRVVELSRNSCKLAGTVPAGKLLVDGLGVGDVGSVVLRDRKHLAQDGMIVVVVNLSSDDGSIISGPDIITRGFVYVKESGDLMEELREIATEAVDECVDQHITDWATIKASIKSSLSNYLYKNTKRNPMILPVIMEI